MSTQQTTREAIIALHLPRLQRAMMRAITLELLRGSGRNVDKITDESLDAMAVATANLVVEQIVITTHGLTDEGLGAGMMLEGPKAKDIAADFARRGAKLLIREVGG